MSERLPPLNQALADLIAIDRADESLPAGARERVGTRLAATVGLGAAAALTTKVAANTATAVTKSASAGISAKVATGIAIVAFGAGTGTGVAVHSTLMKDRIDGVPITSAPGSTSNAPNISSATVPSPPSAPVETPEPSARPAIPSASATPSSTRSRDADLGEERAMIERARRDLSKGNATGALSTLNEHARAFPRGRMGEEREALTVIALAKGGQLDAAKVRAKRFRATYPKSVLLPAVMGATGELQ